MLHPDEPTNLAVGTRMADNGDWNPHFFSYPSLLFDVVALIDRADRLIVGHLLTPSGLTSQNMGIARTTDPGIVLSIRLVTLALSVGICMVVYGVFRRTTERRWTAVGCGLLAATSPLLVTNGVFITPDTYAAFFALVALVSALAVLRRGAPRDYVLAGLAIGFAAGSKYDVVSASPLVIAYALRQGRNTVRPRDLRLLLLAMAVAAAAFALTTPAALFDTGSVVSGVKTEMNHYSTGHAGNQGGAFGFYLKALWRDQPVLPIGAVVAAVAAFRGRFRKEIAVVAAYAVGYFSLISSQAVRFDRSLLPLIPALILLTGYAATWGAEVLTERWPLVPPLGRSALTTATVVGVLIPAIIGALDVPRQLDEHPRVEAAAWLKAHVPAGSSVVVEIYAPWLDPASYRLTEVAYAASKPPPEDVKAIIVTEKGTGRFLNDAHRYPAQAAAYEALFTRFCRSARFTDGPWVEVLTPCR